MNNLVTQKQGEVKSVYNASQYFCNYNTDCKRLFSVTLNKALTIKLRFSASAMLCRILEETALANIYTESPEKKTITSN